MKNALSSRCVFQVLCAIGLACTGASSLSQTPAQLEYERQQREYWRQQEQQRQEQQRQQQLMQDNARRQQEESRRAMQGLGGNSGAPGGVAGSSPSGGSAQGSAGAASAQLEQARQEWLKRPPLPPDRNPLLGRWTRPASSGSHSTDPFAQIQALAKGGLCEALFGGGVFEFRQDRLMGMDNRSPPQELDRVEYRGDAKRVIVIPKKSFKLMEWNIEGPDRINWASQKCVLVRAGPAAGAAAASTSAPASSAAPANAQRTAAAAGGVLVLTAGASTAASQQFFILNEDPQVTLIKAGLKSTPDGSVLQNWLRACAGRTPNCQKGGQALQPHTLGVVKSDESRRAQTPALPAGRYWVLSDAKIGDKRWVWNQLVDVKAGTQSLTLDQHNGVPVD